jgi:hypothetical protein
MPGRLAGPCCRLAGPPGPCAEGEGGGGKGAAGRAELGFQLGFGPLPDRS